MSQTKFSLHLGYQFGFIRTKYIGLAFLYRIINSKSDYAIPVFLYHDSFMCLSFWRYYDFESHFLWPFLYLIEFILRAIAVTATLFPAKITTHLLLSFVLHFKSLLFVSLRQFKEFYFICRLLKAQTPLEFLYFQKSVLPLKSPNQLFLSQH